MEDVGKDENTVEEGIERVQPAYLEGCSVQGLGLHGTWLCRCINKVYFLSRPVRGRRLYIQGLTLEHEKKL